MSESGKTAKFPAPTPEELEVVSSLKQRLAVEAPDLGFAYNDTTILRFYRGRHHVVEKAFNALIRHVQWRNENKIDEILLKKELFADEMSSNKCIVQGRDLDGRPAVFIYAGRHDKNLRDLEQCRMLIIYTLETILKMTKPEEERIVICFDLSEFTFNCMDYEVLKLLVNILQFNYPETMQHALVIESPFIFSACWAVIRPWLDPVTAAKAKFINKDQLCEYFSSDELPEEFKKKC